MKNFSARDFIIYIKRIHILQRLNMLKYNMCVYEEFKYILYYSQKLLNCGKEIRSEGI
jgi:hypothetical protein